MRLLLDTHIVLWCLQDSKKLTVKARKILENSSEIYVSAASLWEMAIKVKLGKLNIDLIETKNMIFKSNFLELPVTFEHIMSLDKLPYYHKDPFDRILISQAISEPLKLITADHAIKKYSDLIEII